MRDRIKNLIAQALGIEPTDVEEKSLLREDLGIDFAELAILLDVLNKDLKITLSPEDLTEVRTVEELIDLTETWAPEII